MRYKSGPKLNKRHHIKLSGSMFIKIRSCFGLFFLLMLVETPHKFLKLSYLVVLVFRNIIFYILKDPLITYLMSGVYPTKIPGLRK